MIYSQPPNMTQLMVRPPLRGQDARHPVMVRPSCQILHREQSRSGDEPTAIKVIARAMWARRDVPVPLPGWWSCGPRGQMGIVRERLGGG
jgi:hypothetical protein